MEHRLVGQQRNLDIIRRTLADPSDAAAAVEVVGEPGIGKTAILDAALDGLDGVLVVRTAATAVEQPLTWTGLAQLIDRWPPADLESLPVPQRAALDGALGRVEEPPQPGLVASAVAHLVETATARGPVVLAVDDAHWLDTASAGVFSFALRANRHRPIRLLCARRPDPAPIEPHRLVEPAAFRSLTVTGLSTAGVHDLLTAAGVTLSRPQLVLVHEATGGNPLHVLELARRLSAGVPIEEAVRSSSLESVVGQRVRALSGTTRAVLGAAALTATPTIEVLIRCFDEGTVLAALDEAEQAQLVTVVDHTVRFAHPTVSAAADAVLGAGTRRRLHGRLADLVAVDERVVHLDASTDGPSEAVAAALDAAARDAWERGAIEVAARRMRRALERTPAAPTDVRWERRLALADMLLDVGAARDAITVLAPDADAGPDDPVLARRASRARATCLFHGGRERDAVEELTALASSLPAGDPMRVDALLAQARMTVFFDVAASVDVARAAAAEAPATGDDRLIGTTAACELSSRFVAGQPVEVTGTPASLGRRLSAAELVDEVLLWNDDLDLAEPGILERISGAEHRGDLATIANCSLQAGEVRIRRGDPSGARTRYEVALEAASMTDDHAWVAAARASLAVMAAYLGDNGAVLAHTAALRDASTELSLADQMAVHSSVGTALLLGHDAPGAVEHFRRARAASLTLRLHDCNAMPFRAHMVEALLAVGAVEEAREVSAELTRFATAAGRTRGIGDAHRAAALVAAAAGDLDAAQRSIEAAITEHDRLPGPLEGAWSRLVAGMIERRARRRAVARDHLQRAHDVGVATGAVALARRAEAELARLGTGSTGGTVGRLTPTEEQVARLVGLGHTNVEVAALLHMSTKTVEANLTRIYRKLGVRSRTELAARVPS